MCSHVIRRKIIPLIIVVYGGGLLALDFAYGAENLGVPLSVNKSLVLTFGTLFNFSAEIAVGLIFTLLIEFYPHPHTHTHTHLTHIALR